MLAQTRISWLRPHGRHQPRHLARRDRLAGKIFIALLVVLALSLVWARNFFGLVGPSAGALEVASATCAISADGRFLTIDTVIRNGRSDPVLAQIQPSLNPTGMSQPWNARLLEGPIEQITLASGALQSRDATIELDLPAGRYDAWMWMRVYANGAWVGISQRRINRSALVVSFGSPILREKSPGMVDLGAVSLSGGSQGGAPVTLSATIDNRTDTDLPVAVRWGLDPVGPNETTSWFRHSLVSSGGVRWISASPGLTDVKLSGRALVGAGAYRVRVQVVSSPAPAVPTDAASASMVPSAALDDVLVTAPVLTVPASGFGLVRVAPPAGPLAVTSLTPPATLTKGRPARITLTISNLSDSRADGTVFVILAASGNRQPWAAALAASYPVPVSVAAESSQDVTVTLSTDAAAGSYELSAWIHGAVASTLSVHVDGAYSAQPVSVVDQPRLGSDGGSAGSVPQALGDGVRLS